MKFEELQQEWQAIKSEPKSHNELRRMMYAPPVWRFRGLTQKELLELIGSGMIIVGLDILVAIYEEHWYRHWYDLLTWIPAFVVVLNPYLQWCYLRFLPQKDTLQETLISALTRIKRLALVSQIVNVLIWIALVLILGNKVQMGAMNMILWALILLPLLVAVNWWSSRRWSRNNDEVKALLKELSEEPSLPVV